MRRILMLVAIAVLMVAMMVAMAAPAFTRATNTNQCLGGTSLAEVPGEECDHTTTSSSGNVSTSLHFTPTVKGEGGTVEQGAEHNLNGGCDNPTLAECNTTFTPSGTANGHFLTKP
jgi:hypothetical protein